MSTIYSSVGTGRAFLMKNGMDLKAMLQEKSGEEISAAEAQTPPLETSKSPSRVEKMKARRSKKYEMKQESAVLSEKISGYCGDKSINDIMKYIEFDIKHHYPRSAHKRRSTLIKVRTGSSEENGLNKIKYNKTVIKEDKHLKQLSIKGEEVNPKEGDNKHSVKEIKVKEKDNNNKEKIRNKDEKDYNKENDYISEKVKNTKESKETVKTNNKETNERKDTKDNVKDKKNIKCVGTDDRSVTNNMDIKDNDNYNRDAKDYVTKDKTCKDNMKDNKDVKDKVRDILNKEKVIKDKNVIKRNSDTTDHIPNIALQSKDEKFELKKGRSMEDVSIKSKKVKKFVDTHFEKPVENTKVNHPVLKKGASLEHICDNKSSIKKHKKQNSVDIPTKQGKALCLNEIKESGDSKLKQKKKCDDKSQNKISKPLDENRKKADLKKGRSLEDINDAVKNKNGRKNKKLSMDETANASKLTVDSRDNLKKGKSLEDINKNHACNKAKKLKKQHDENTKITNKIFTAKEVPSKDLNNQEDSSNGTKVTKKNKKQTDDKRQGEKEKCNVTFKKVKSLEDISNKNKARKNRKQTSVDENQLGKSGEGSSAAAPIDTGKNTCRIKRVKSLEDVNNSNNKNVKRGKKQNEEIVTTTTTSNTLKKGKSLEDIKEAVRNVKKNKKHEETSGNNSNNKQSNKNPENKIVKSSLKKGRSLEDINEPVKKNKKQPNTTKSNQTSMICLKSDIVNLKKVRSLEDMNDKLKKTSKKEHNTNDGQYSSDRFMENITMDEYYFEEEDLSLYADSEFHLVTKKRRRKIRKPDEDQSNSINSGNILSRTENSEDLSKRKPIITESHRRRRRKSVSPVHDSDKCSDTDSVHSLPVRSTSTTPKRKNRRRRRIPTIESELQNSFVKTRDVNDEFNSDKPIATAVSKTVSNTSLGLHVNADLSSLSYKCSVTCSSDVNDLPSNVENAALVFKIDSSDEVVVLSEISNTEQYIVNNDNNNVNNKFNNNKLTTNVENVSNVKLKKKDGDNNNNNNRNNLSNKVSANKINTNDNNSDDNVTGGEFVEFTGNKCQKNNKNHGATSVRNEIKHMGKSNGSNATEGVNGNAAISNHTQHIPTSTVNKALASTLSNKGTSTLPHLYNANHIVSSYTLESPKNRGNSLSLPDDHQNIYEESPTYNVAEVLHYVRRSWTNVLNNLSASKVQNSKMKRVHYYNRQKLIVK